MSNRLSDSIFGGGDHEHRDPSRTRRPSEVGEPTRGRLPQARPAITRREQRERMQRAQAAEQERAGARAVATETPERVVPPEAKRRRSCLALVLAMALIVGGLGFAATKLGGLIPSFGGGGGSGADYSGNGSGSVDVTVNPGDSGYQIGQTLSAAGVVKSATTFSAVAGANTDFAKVKPGTYRLHKQMSSASAVALMLDPKAFVSGGVTIPEGLWKSEIFARLAKASGLPVSDYEKVPASSLDLPAWANGKLDGFLYPSTYNFKKGATAQQQLQVLVRQANSEFASLGIRADALKATLTTASIIQAEAGSADMGKVSRVIANRLKPGNAETNGKLQMDSTIHYAQQKRGSIKVSSADTRIDSAYNTYQIVGLPPGPINSPGAAALKAALNPVPGPWYYFVTINQDTGETLFATTLSQQQANEQKFHAWCDAHQSTCKS